VKKVCLFVLSNQKTAWIISNTLTVEGSSLGRTLGNRAQGVRIWEQNRGQRSKKHRLSNWLLL